MGRQAVRGWGALPGLCGEGEGWDRAAGAPPAAEDNGVMAEHLPRGAEPSSAARAGAQEAVHTAWKFSFKAWNDLWVITSYDSRLPGPGDLGLRGAGG